MTAQPGNYDWQRYERTIDPDAQLDGLGDLCQFLGGSWADTPGSGSITALVLQLIVKAQATPQRFAPIAQAFPREVTAWRTWQGMSPSPTAHELYTELTTAAPGEQTAAHALDVWGADGQALAVAGTIVHRSLGVTVPGVDWPTALMHVTASHPLAQAVALRTLASAATEAAILLEEKGAATA